jgi:hypothetical protein
VGQQVAAQTFSREDRQRYRRKVRASLDAFARMLSEARFHPERQSIGLEIELNLTDDAGDPALVNAAVLEVIADPSFQTELGQFNVEINLPPRLLEGAVFSELERDARKSLNDAEQRARTVGAHMMLIGILPTVTQEHLRADAFSANPRYSLLNEQIFAARGEDLEISISGVERLATHADTIAPEARARAPNSISRSNRRLSLATGTQRRRSRIGRGSGRCRPPSSSSGASSKREHMHSNEPVHEWRTS